jgi:UPF0716 protein FxsA
MPLFFLFAILLVFPVLEIWILIELGNRYGIKLLIYLMIVGVLGWRLIREEKSLMVGRMVQSFSQGGTPVKAVFGSAKNLIAGVLLLIPGVISDAIAVILLLIPTPEAAIRAQGGKRQAANDDVIEGEYRRED